MKGITIEHIKENCKTIRELQELEKKYREIALNRKSEAILKEYKHLNKSGGLSKFKC